MVNEQPSWAITAGGCVKTVWARMPLKNVNSPQVLGCSFSLQMKRANVLRHQNGRCISKTINR